MALPRKGSRTITVDGRCYRWLVTRIDGESAMRLVVEDAESPAQRIVHRFDGVRSISSVPRVTPRMVAAFVRTMRNRGWSPTGRGPDVTVTSKDVGSPVFDPQSALGDVTMVALSLKLRTSLDPPRYDYPWKHYGRAFVDVFCDGNTSDKAIGTMVADLLSHADIPPSDQRSEIFAQWAQSISALQNSHDKLHPGGFCLSGGVAVTQWEDLYLVPGCCVCIGGWDEWLHLTESGEPPWNGHDPFSSAQLVDELRVSFVPGRDGVESPIEVSIAEYHRLLYGLRMDIQKFAARFERWLVNHTPEHWQLIADTMCTYLKLQERSSP